VLNQYDVREDVPNEQVENLKKVSLLLLVQCRNQMKWLNELLQNLQYKVVTPPYPPDGFVYYAVPDWDIKQRLESLQNTVDKAATILPRNNI